MNDTSICNIQELLEARAQIQGKHKQPDWQYGSFEELLLDKALSIPVHPQANEFRFEDCQPKLCYSNAQAIAVECPEFTYVEGFAISANVMLPLEHAWVMKDGYAIEPTWSEPGIAYFGIPFNRDWWLQFIRERRQRIELDDLSILSGNYLDDFTLLRFGLPSEAIAQEVSK